MGKHTLLDGEAHLIGWGLIGWGNTPYSDPQANTIAKIFEPLKISTGSRLKDAVNNRNQYRCVLHKTYARLVCDCGFGKCTCVLVCNCV